MTDKIAAAFGIDPSTLERTPTDSTSREAFEQWYVEHTHDLRLEPIGSRECAQQWAAWQACAGDVTERQAQLVEKIATMTLSSYALKTVAALIREGTFTCP